MTAHPIYVGGQAHLPLSDWHAEKMRMRRRRRLVGRIQRVGLIGTALFSAWMLWAARAEAQEVRQEYLRVTFYNLPGRMADGTMVHEGAAACSAWMPFGTVLEFPDGRQVTCQDRGHGDWYWRGWTDVWVPSMAAGRAVERAYGLYAWVNVVRWGWDG